VTDVSDDQVDTNPSPALIEMAVDGYLREQPVVGQVDDFIAETLVEDSGIPDLPAAPGEDVSILAVAANQGKLLNLLARAMGASRILEIGTLLGYSTVWLARAVPEDGKVVTIEANAEYAKLAAENLDRAGVGDRVDVRLGVALDTLAELREEGAGPFDLVFVDADKENDVAYAEHAIELGRPGTLIVVDNVVRFGGVVTPEAAEYDAGARGSHELLKFIGSHPRLDGTAIQTVGKKGWDGLAVALVTD
jgi:predicted O-methyltransferase YrrM